MSECPLDPSNSLIKTATQYYWSPSSSSLCLWFAFPIPPHSDRSSRFRLECELRNLRFHKLLHVCRPCLLSPLLHKEIAARFGQRECSTWQYSLGFASYSKFAFPTCANISGKSFYAHYDIIIYSVWYIFYVAFSSHLRHSKFHNHDLWQFTVSVPFEVSSLTYSLGIEMSGLFWVDVENEQSFKVYQLST